MGLTRVMRSLALKTACERVIQCHWYQVVFPLFMSTDQIKKEHEDVCCLNISGQLPTRTIPFRTGIGPDDWFYSVVVALVGSCPRGESS